MHQCTIVSNYNIYYLVTDVKSMNMYPVHQACWRNNLHILKYLVEDANCDISDINALLLVITIFIIL